MNNIFACFWILHVFHGEVGEDLVILVKKDSIRGFISRAELFDPRFCFYFHYHVIMPFLLTKITYYLGGTRMVVSLLLKKSMFFLTLFVPLPVLCVKLE